MTAHPGFVPSATARTEHQDYLAEVQLPLQDLQKTRFGGHTQFTPEDEDLGLQDLSRSKLTYAAPAWYALCSDTRKKLIQAQENIALRMFTGLSGYVRNDVIIRDWTIPPVEEFVVLACLALDFLLIGLGMSVSFVTMVLPEVLDAKEGLSINKKEASWFGSMAFLCQPLGSIFSGPILDLLGRKKALCIVNIPHLVAWLMMYYAWNVPSLFLANALLGIGTGIMEAPAVTYIGEVCDPALRGILTTLTNGFTATGIFMAYLLGTVLPWRQAALVALIIPLTTMVLVLFVPETPVWLLSKGRQKEALSSLCRLRGWAQPEHVKEEFEQLLQYKDNIKVCVVCSKDGDFAPSHCKHQDGSMIKRIAYNVKNVLFVKETMRPLLLVMAYFLFHTMSGLTPVKPNMVNVCKALGMAYNPKAIVVLVGVVSITTGLLSALIVKSIGKRKLVLGSLFGMAVCSLGISVYAASTLSPNVSSYDPDTFPNKKAMLPLVLFMLLVCFHGLGIPWVLLSEVFPFRSRGIATGFAAAFCYIMFFITSKTNYNLENLFNLSGTFAIYGIFGLVGTVYLYLFLPETENKSLMEIEAFYKGKNKIFADDILINAFRKDKTSYTTESNDAVKPML